MIPSLAEMLGASRKDSPALGTRVKYNMKNPRKPIGIGHRARSVEAKRLERLNPPTERVCIKCKVLKQIDEFRFNGKMAMHIKTCLKCEEK